VRRPPPLSLRARLTLVVVAVTGVVLLASALATYELTRRSLLERVDGQLLAAGAPALTAPFRLPVAGPVPTGGTGDAAAVPDAPPADVVRAPASSGVLRADVLLALVGPGRVRVVAPGTGGTPAAAARALPADLRGRVADAPEGRVLFTVRLPEGEYRAVARAVPGTGGLVVFGQPLRDVDAALARLLAVLGLVGAVLIVAAAAAALVLVRLGLRPLDRVVRAADAVQGAVAEDAGPAPVRPGAGAHLGVPGGGPREVARVAQALDGMLAGIDEAFARRRASEEALRTFVADASHELRTPLTSIRGYAELFRRGAAKRPGDLAHAMGRIEAEAARLSGIVDDLLTLARLDEAPAASTGPVWLDPLLEEVVADARAAHPGHRFALRTPGDVVVEAAEDEVRRALLNVLANAGRHTPPGTAVHVRVRCADGGAEVEVADEGPGWPAADPAALFGRFVRGDAGRARSAGGSGLGLAIVAALAARWGGDVVAEPAPGGGALVRLRLRRALVPA